MFEIRCQRRHAAAAAAAAASAGITNGVSHIKDWLLIFGFSLAIDFVVVFVVFVERRLFLSLCDAYLQEASEAGVETREPQMDRLNVDAVTLVLLVD